MKIRIDLKILFFLILFYFTKQLDIYIFVMIFAFFHELSHILVAVILNFKVLEIECMPLGFFTNLEANIDDYNKKIKKSNLVELKKIFITVIGPISNLIMIGFLYLINIFIVIPKFNIMIYSNLLIFLINILPIFPLDGGRFIKSILKIIFGYEKANKIIKLISYAIVIIFTIIASILILYLKNIAILFIILYLWKIII